MIIYESGFLVRLPGRGLTYVSMVAMFGIECEMCIIHCSLILYLKEFRHIIVDRKKLFVIYFK